jgi:hypothetical protein
MLNVIAKAEAAGKDRADVAEHAIMFAVAVDTLRTVAQALARDSTDAEALSIRETWQPVADMAGAELGFTSEWISQFLEGRCRIN